MLLFPRFSLRGVSLCLFFKSSLSTGPRRMANSKYEYVRRFEEANDPVLLPNCYIIVRVDGHDFHRFSKSHKFHKPNDKRCLDLLVKSAQHVMAEFAPWITIAYGQSDEFSFLFRRSAEIHRRRQNKITSLVASTFTSAFVLNWSQFFPSTRLLYPPTFDSRCVLYPDKETVRDYFRWRQVDCHINNLYNTTFHALIGEYQVVRLVHNSRTEESEGKNSRTEESEGKNSRTEEFEGKNSRTEEFEGKNSRTEEFEVTKLEAYENPNMKILTPQEATKRLEGSLSADKNELLFSTYGINYNNELEQFRKGSTILLTNGSDFDRKYLTKEEKRKRKLEPGQRYLTKEEKGKEEKGKEEADPKYLTKEEKGKEEKGKEEEAGSAHEHRAKTVVLTGDVIKEQFWIENSTLL